MRKKKQAETAKETLQPEVNQSQNRTLRWRT
jgi:hypothetical protein